MVFPLVTQVTHITHIAGAAVLGSRARRTVAALGLCLGLAGTSLAARSGPPVDPAAAVVAAARTHLGDAYAWGGTGPHTWDCSGLVYALWRQVGGVAGVPRVARDQQAWAVPLPEQQVLPGDLVFFGRPATHVGIVTSRTASTVVMIDAGTSREAVVERPVWTTEPVGYGRVPRPTMPAVTPWTGPVVAPAAPVAAPVPPRRPARPVPSSRLSTPGQPTLPALTQKLPSSRTALAAAALARKALGARYAGDAAFVARVWRQAGGKALPTSKSALARLGVPVALADARIGDLVLYGAPESHVGIYVGGGLMVDASRALGKVVLRPVWASRTLRLLRIV